MTGRTSRMTLIAILVCLVPAAAAWAKGYMTPGFQSKQPRPMKIVLLPPHAEFIKEKVIMTDQMLKESAALESEAAAALKAQLEEKGYKVRALTPAEINRTPALGELVKRAKDRYNEEWSRIVQRPKKVKEHRYGAGEDAQRLCALLKVDGIALARIQAVGVSKGKASFSAIMNMGPPPAAQLRAPRPERHRREAGDRRGIFRRLREHLPEPARQEARPGHGPGHRERAQEVSRGQRGARSRGGHRRSPGQG